MSNKISQHFARPVVDKFITKRMAIATNGSTVVEWSDYRDILSYFSHIESTFATLTAEKKSLMEENAELKAAAPELLEALQEAKEALQWYKSEREVNGRPAAVANGALETINAAIAKAGGSTM